MSGVIPEIEALCGLSEVNTLLMVELRSLGQVHKLQGWEIPAAILVDPHPFTEENHLLTCTLKKSRPQLEKKYKEQLESLYEPLNESLLTKQ